MKRRSFLFCFSCFTNTSVAWRSTRRTFRKFRALKSVQQQKQGKKSLHLIKNIPSKFLTDSFTNGITFLLSFVMKYCLSYIWRDYIRKSWLLGRLVWAFMAWTHSAWSSLNFRSSRSEYRRIICSSGTSYDGFWSSKIVKGSVGPKTRFKTRTDIFSHTPANISRGYFMFLSIWTWIIDKALYSQQILN